MEKRILAEGAGKYEKGQWKVKNLKFLAQFMKSMGLTTGDLAKAVNLQRHSVTRWFLVDDAYLSKVQQIAEAYGCEFIISYEVPQDFIENTKLVIDTKISRIEDIYVEDCRLAFLRRAMLQSKLSVKALATTVSLTRSSINRWFKKDDITFRYIYQIAEAMGWTLNMCFKAKQ